MRNLDPNGLYVAYLRKSRADLEAEAHGEGETLARHQKLLTEYAEKAGIHISKFYREIVSGETISDRPVIQELLHDISLGDYDGVLVVEVERLARGDTSDQGTIAKYFKFSETMIITPGKTYDPNDEFDEEYFEFGLFMSRREYKTINRRIQRGRVASAKEGKFLSSVPPYGYNKVKIKNDKGYTLDINEEQAAVIRKIFDLYINGEILPDGSRFPTGMTRICQILDAEGIHPSKNGVWSPSSISDILQNPVYYGKIRWSYTKEVKQMVDGKIIIKRVKSKDCIFVNGLHPPIINEDTFFAAKEIIRGKLHNSTSAPGVLQNPLSGFVYCKRCGAKMTRLAPTKKTPYAVLKCPNRYCDQISSPLYLVEDNLISFLHDWFTGYKLDWSAGRVANTQFAEEIKNRKNALDDLISQKAEINRQINNAYDFLEKGIYTVDIFTTRRELLSRRLEDVQKSTLKLQNDISNLEMSQNNQENFIPEFQRIMDAYWKIPDAETRNDMLKKILERVEYNKEVRNKRGDRDNANFILDIYPKLPRL